MLLFALQVFDLQEVASSASSKTGVCPCRQPLFLLFAFQAYELQEAGKQYIVKDEKVVLVDENTGRLRPSNRYQDGLHQVCAVCACVRGGGTVTRECKFK
jgi:hypothetical protein